MVVIHTDGACSGNPGPGGWGAILEYKSKTKKISGAELETTNNRMELMAAIMSLKALKKHSTVKIITDSNYVKNGITNWIHNWKKNNWRNAAKKPVKNADLWKELDEQVNNHNVAWEWVKGHSGNEGNEIADELARNAIQKLLKEENYK